jgi:hypothetical protein
MTLLDNGFGFPGTGLRAALSAAALLAGVAAARSQPPEWQRDLREIDITKEECTERAVKAHEVAGLRVDHRDNTFVVGIRDGHTATIGCFPLGQAKTWMTILVASNGGAGGRVARSLSDAMTMPDEPPSVGGVLLGDPKAPAPRPDMPQACRGTAWDFSPGAQHRRKNGQRFQHLCPPDGCNNGRLAGTEVYSDDSSVCLAAVHAGLITFRDGGSVTYEIVPDTGRYQPSVRNGLLSRSSSGHNGAFRLVR